MRWPTVVGQNGLRQARRGLGDGETAVGMHLTEDMIHKERQDGQAGGNAWGGDGSSGGGRYTSGVK